MSQHNNIQHIPNQSNVIDLLSSQATALTKFISNTSDPAHVQDAQVLLEKLQTAKKQMLTALSIAKQLNNSSSSQNRVTKSLSSSREILEEVNTFHKRCQTLNITTGDDHADLSKEHKIIQTVGIAVANGFTTINAICSATGLSFAEVAGAIRRAQTIIDVFAGETQRSVSNEYRILSEIKNAISTIVLERQILYASPEQISDAQLTDLGFNPASRKHNPGTYTPGESTGYINETAMIVPGRNGGLVYAKGVDYALINAQLKLAARIGELDKAGDGQRNKVYRNSYSIIEDGYEQEPLNENQRKWVDEQKVESNKQYGNNIYDEEEE